MAKWFSMPWTKTMNLPGSKETVVVERENPGELYYLFVTGNAAFGAGKVHLFLDREGTDLLDVDLVQLVTYGVVRGQPAPGIISLTYGSPVTNYTLAIVGPIHSEYLKLTYEAQSGTNQSCNISMLRLEGGNASAGASKEEQLLSQVLAELQKLNASVTPKGASTAAPRPKGRKGIGY